ncbi:hypothetical protein KVR01_013211 [Diaporthe batatas]|uniref:uncharacterized protein n=1 Tax=Diaporthe batatas TaxID=748121 RepID=UPI001D039F8E|nr:uncharacterized protein KVR01_013211 [Diaporthe batatas]KAG8156989.1 hypothetical protein KVR01_013211 [Diaporthe batatas]
MAPKNTRIVGDARDEKDENKAANEAKWAAKNLGSKNPSTLGASRWNPGEPQWSLQTTRDEIFARMKVLERRKAPNDQQLLVRANQARRKVYEHMYAEGCDTTDVGAAAINVEYFIDAKLWEDHIQSITKEVFPWQWPDIFREDAGYAEFARAKASMGKWSDSVLADDGVRRDQRAKDSAELEKKMQAEGKDWADMAAPLNETFTSTHQDEEGNRVRGEQRTATHGGPAAGEAASKEATEKEEEEPTGEGDKAEPEKAKPKKAGPKKAESKHISWTPKLITKLYKNIFGQDAACLDGMGGFKLPFEEKFVGVLKNSTVVKA